MKPSEAVNDAFTSSADTSSKHKRTHDGQGPRQPARKKSSRQPPPKKQQQQQQRLVQSDQPLQRGTSHSRLREEVMKLLNAEAEDVPMEDSPLLAAAAAAAAVTGPDPPAHSKDTPQHQQQQRRQQPLRSCTVLPAQPTGFGSSAQQHQQDPASPVSTPDRRAAALAAVTALRLRSTSTGLDGIAAAEGLLALAAAAGSCSPCSSPTSAGTSQQLPGMLAAAAAGEDGDHAAAAAAAAELEGVVVQALGPVFPTKSPSEALEAAFPFAPAAATRQAIPAADSAAAVQQQQHRAPAAAVGARVGPVTADGLVVSDVGVFMGNRMFKTPFSSWASWLKDAGPGSDAVLSTPVSELLPTFSPFLSHLRQQVASKARGGPGLAAWTARGYVCYAKLVVEKLQAQQPDADHKQLLRKLTLATNEFEQMARHGRAHEALSISPPDSPPESPKAAAAAPAAVPASSHSSKAAGPAGPAKPKSSKGSKAPGKISNPKASSNGSSRPPVAPGVMKKLRPRSGNGVAAAGVAAAAAVAAAEQSSEPEEEGYLAAGPVQQQQEVKQEAAASILPAAPAAAAAEQAAGAAAITQAQVLQQLQAYAAEVEAAASLAALPEPEQCADTVPPTSAETEPTCGTTAPVDPCLAAAEVEGVATGAGATASASAAPAVDVEVDAAAVTQAQVLQQLQAYAAEVAAAASGVGAAEAGAAAGPYPDGALQETPAAPAASPSAAPGAAVAVMQAEAAPARAGPRDAAELQTEGIQVDTVDVLQADAATPAAPATATATSPPAPAAAAAAAEDASSPLEAAPAFLGAPLPAQAAAAASSGAAASPAAAARKGTAGPAWAPPSGFLSLADLQHQVSGCELGLQVLWDVAQERHGAGVSAMEIDAAGLLLDCTDEDTLSAFQACALEAACSPGGGGDVGGEDGQQAQLEQTLELVTGLLQLLQQPAVVQLLGQQHRQRLEGVRCVSEELAAAAVLGGECHSDGGSEGSAGDLGGEFEGPGVPRAMQHAGVV